MHKLPGGWPSDDTNVCIYYRACLRKTILPEQTTALDFRTTLRLSEEPVECIRYQALELFRLMYFKTGFARQFQIWIISNFALNL